MTSVLDRALGGFLGLAIGDTIGAQVEFKPRGSFPLVTDMVGGGVFNLRPGQTTDDTAMALILARSLVANKGFNADDVMSQFLQWSKMSFDVGATISSALRRFERTGDPYQGSDDDWASGNGSIMRLYPAFVLSHAKSFDDQRDLIWDTTRITHASFIVRTITEQMVKLLNGIYLGKDKSEILKNLSAPVEAPPSSGFVIHTFEAALWGFATTDNFRDGLLKVVNLGDDADTVGAVYGQIAGSYYGRSGLPEEWVNKLEDKSEIESLAKGLLE